MNEPISRSGLAALVVNLTLELSAVRAAYRASVHLLAQRHHELRVERQRYEQLLEEFRNFRERVLRKAAA